jgi:hypothetical protein
MRGVLRGDFRSIGAGLCRIVDMNFREYLFQRLSEKPHERAKRLSIRRLIAT